MGFAGGADVVICDWCREPTTAPVLQQGKALHRVCYGKLMDIVIAVKAKTAGREP